MMKRIVNIGITVCLVLGGVVFATQQNAFNLKEYKPAPLQEEIQETYTVKITTKEIQDKTETLEYDLKIPVVEGVKDEKIQSQINEVFEKNAVDFKNEIESYGKEYIKEAKKQGWEIRPYEALSDYKIAYNKDNILSICITNYEYTGGAHGMSHQKNYNINLKSGKEILLKDLFKEKSNYKAHINKEIKKQMKAQTDAEEVVYFEDDLGFKSISDNQSYYFEEGHIVIHFGLYEIASYAVGMPEFRIALKDLKESLKPEFLGK